MSAETDRESDRRRRLLLLLIALLTVIFAAGMASVLQNLDGADSGPPAIEVTTPTPTPTGEVPTPTSTTGTPTPVPPATPTATPGGGATTPPATTPDGGTATATPRDEPAGASTPVGPGSGGDARDGGSGPVGSAGSGAGGDSGVDGTDGNSPADGGSVAFTTDGSAVTMSYRNVLPGDGGRDTVVVVRNVGGRPGQVTLSGLTVADAENGIRGPETGVDDSPATGELSDHLELALWAVHDDGSRRYLYGTDAGAKTLTTLASVPSAEAGVLAPGESLRLVVDWQLPAGTGNVVQSDGTTIALTVSIEPA